MIGGYLRDNAGQIARLFGWHAYLSVLPVVIGLAVAVPLGYLARRYRSLYGPMVGGSGLLYTIPSLALFIALPAILGTEILDPLNVVIALTLYTIALLVRTVADGLAAVPAAVLQAASAMGYGRLRRLLAVELPIAVPVIGAGLRVATVSNVSMVAVAALVGVPQLGQLMTDGFQRDYYTPLVTAIVLCVVLAVVLDSLIVVGIRLLTPWQRVVVSAGTATA